MALTLVLGPANSAKAGEVLGSYATAARRGATLVVPTTLDAGHYSRELAAEGAILGSVVTFRGLAGEIARRAGYGGRRLSTLQRERVLRQVIAATRLSALNRSASSDGFAAAAGELIAELQRSLVTPQRFTQAMRAWAAEDDRRAAYAEDVASLYATYARELGRRGRVDSELYAWRALDLLRGAPAAWGRDPVFFYGFDDLTPLERDAIETLSRVVGVDVTVSLTYEAGRAALTARAEVVEELRPLAERVVELPAIDEYYEPQSRAALHHLERSLFERSAERIDPGTAVELLESGGERAEAELVAAEVLALLRSGVPAEEIVIVYRSLTTVAPVLTQVFDQYGLALATRQPIPFAQTGLGRGVSALARCALLGEHDARAEDLLTYLRSPGILERRELADALEVEVRREGLGTAAQARERFGWRLEEIDSLCDAPDVGGELGRQARRMLAAPRRGEAAELSPEEELDARALGALLRLIGELDELQEQVSGPDLIELLDTLSVPAGAPVRRGAVLVAEPLEIRARRFRAVFVCGLQEGEFPLAGSPEPFLSDERRRELALASGLRLRLREDALGRERYLFYSCLSRARERLVLSYRSSDEEGNIALPSPFVSDVADLLVEDWPKRRRRRLLADVVWSPDSAPTSRELARARASAQAPRAGAPAPPERCLGVTALAHVRHMEVLSGGALETYADCPVKWLVERELQPASLEPEIEPIARGSYMHAALEQVLLRLDGPVTVSTLPDARRILQDVLAELPPTLAPGRSPSVRAAAFRAVEADLNRYLEYEAASGCTWEPRGLELQFGFEAEEGSLRALEIGEGAERVRVRGVIDRVDVDPASSRAIVRDYKSGSPRPEHQGARWGSDRRLQVALYMIAVRDLLGLEPIAGLYQPLGGSDLRARGIYLEDAAVGARVVGNDARDADALRAELDDAADRATRVAARLRAGDLGPCPETCSRDGCRYPGICRSQ